MEELWMNQEIGSRSTAYGRSGSASTTDVVRGEAAGVGQSVKDAGGYVAQTAADQAREVAAETTRQARDLMREGREQLREQAAAGQQKAAQGLHSVADELQEMADGSDRSGTASELARQGAQRLHGFASWLENRQPGDLIEEVRSFARRRPGAFLCGAALAGIVAGRLTGGGVAAMKQSSGGDSSPSGSMAASPTMPMPVQPDPSPRTNAGYPTPGTGYAGAGVGYPAAGGYAGPGAGYPEGSPGYPAPPVPGTPMSGRAEPELPPYPDYEGGNTSYDTGGQVNR
jgi:hypothetical protein